MDMPTQPDASFADARHGRQPPPRVSVLTTMYNSEPFVREAIASILRQTFTDFELVIVDDASTDRSRAIAASFGDARIRLIDNAQNLGLPRSLNIGLAVARGAYVARLDPDDVAFPERLARQVAYLDAHGDVAAAGAQALPLDIAGRPWRSIAWWNLEWARPTSEPAIAWYRMFDTPFVHSASTFRRAIVWDILHGYDERVRIAEDAELWTRIAKRWRLANLDERLVAVRLHTRSMTADPAWHESADRIREKVAMTQSLLEEGLARRDIPARTADLWIAAKWHPRAIAPHDARELVDGLDWCEARFLERHPAARHDRGVARHQASMWLRIAHAVRGDRRLALRIARRALSSHPIATLANLPRMFRGA